MISKSIMKIFNMIMYSYNIDSTSGIWDTTLTLTNSGEGKLLDD